MPTSGRRPLSLQRVEENPASKTEDVEVVMYTSGSTRVILEIVIVKLRSRSRSGEGQVKVR